MNVQLVESLVQAIQSLSQEERLLLKQKLAAPTDWKKLKARIIQRGRQIQARRGGNLSSSINAVIEQMRSERTEQLMQAGFPEQVEE